MRHFVLSIQFFLLLQILLFQEVKSNVSNIASNHRVTNQVNDHLFNSNTKRNIRYINRPDHWNKMPYLFQTYNEPERPYLLPVLSNGYIGTVVNNDSMYLNGLFNGAGEMSHRTRLPAMNSLEVFINPLDRDEIPGFTLDCRRGVYIKEVTTENARLTQYRYAHRLNKHLLVNEIKVELLKNVDVTIQIFNRTTMNVNYQLSFDFLLNPNKNTFYSQEPNVENLNYEQQVIKHPTRVGPYAFLNDGIYQLRTEMTKPELPDKRKKEVYIIYTNVPRLLTVFKNTTTKKFFFIQSVAIDRNKAIQAYNDAITTIDNNPENLLASHISAWENIWQKNGIAMISESVFSDQNKDAFELAQRLYASFYNIYSAITYPFSLTTDNHFYGISPSGLAYGSLKEEFFNVSYINTINTHMSEGYGGHLTYTQELMVLPIVSLFSGDMAKSIIQSRMRRGYNTDHIAIWDQARENAKAENARGIRFAWEQGDFGKDVCQSNEIKKKKIHVTGSIGFGIRSYLRSSHDKNFLLNSLSTGNDYYKGEDFVNDLAEYWNSKLVKNINNEYDIDGVLYGENVVTREVNNEAFTNYLAQINLESCKYVVRMQEKDPYNSINSYKIREYDEKINLIEFPYDGTKGLYLEYEDYTGSHINSETSMPLLTHPLMMPLTYTEKKSLLDKYTMLISNDPKQTMTFAASVVGYLDLNEESKAKEYFTKLSSHFNGPFHVISEYPQSNTRTNNYNYIPGYAAYLHAFIFGYCGIRVRDFQIDIVYPSPDFASYQTNIDYLTKKLLIKPPYQSVSFWNLTGVSYSGFELDIIYNMPIKQIEIKNRKLSDDYPSTNLKSLEVRYYEYAKWYTKTLSVGETLILRIDTEFWPNERYKVQKNNYSENMNILASIYAVQYRDLIEIASGAIKLNHFSYLLIFSFLTVTFISF